MQDIKFNTGGALRDWIYLMISMGILPDAFDQASLQSTVTQFHRTPQYKGITAAAPTQGSRIVVSGPDDTRIKIALKNVPGDSRQVRLLLIILPTAHTFLCIRVKHVGDAKVGVHTVCVVVSKFAKAQPQYLLRERRTQFQSQA